MDINLQRTVELSKNIIIITPVFHSGGAGASIYYQTLSNLLIKNKYQVTVISDSEKGEFQGKYYGVFPSWAGQNKTQKTYFLYMVQNFLYFKLLNIFKKEYPATVIIHTSFFNHIGLFNFVFTILKTTFKKTLFIADVRDALLKDCKVRKLNNFDKIVACSENIKDHLASNGIQLNKIFHIPVIQPHLPKNSDIKILEQHNIDKFKYIFYAGAIKEEKGALLLLKAFTKYISPHYPEIKLVLAGFLKSNNKQLIHLLKSHSIVYLGKLPHKDIISFIQYASICVNPSFNEGLPRISLEAMIMKRPCLLPANIPEFDKYCPQFVMRSQNPIDLAKQIIDIMDEGISPDYPINDHYPENIVSKYLNLFKI
ncbi:MAG: glycosyltransferase family 4 protein [Desulfobacula sp.]|nr:glycosyltransferase family 4 protein [Desulfobacula sp.]